MLLNIRRLLSTDAGNTFKNYLKINSSNTINTINVINKRAVDDFHDNVFPEIILHHTNSMKISEPKLIIYPWSGHIPTSMTHMIQNNHMFNEHKNVGLVDAIESDQKTIIVARNKILRYKFDNISHVDDH